MRDLSEWMGQADFAGKAWLLLGKGPTFDRRHEFDLGTYNTLSLNHVVDAQPVDVAHIIDVDVLAHCPSIETNCRWLVMPRYPHLRSERSSRRLEDWFADYPVLERLDRDGRLVWYNLGGTPVIGSSPVIGAGYFSSEAALAILGRLGAKTVRTLGIDGGRSYASSFSALDNETRLANGAFSFDLQARRLDVIASEHGIDFAPLIEPLRIFIGTDHDQIVAQRVLEYSIRKHASIPVEVTAMIDLDIRLPKDPQNQPRTNFSYYRWKIPELCGYRGRAVYMDADMLVFGDVAELAKLDFDGAEVLCSAPERPDQWKNSARYFGHKNLAVMVIDCERAKWRVDDIIDSLDRHEFTYEQLFGEVCITDPARVHERVPATWNELERFSEHTRLLHYTVVPTQPWKNDKNALGDIWLESYREAVEAGAVPPEEVDEAVRRGAVKASLRHALRLAPSRRAVVTNAALDAASAQRRIEELEREVARLQQSTSWRVGYTLVGRPKEAIKPLLARLRGRRAR